MTMRPGEMPDVQALSAAGLPVAQGFVALRCDVRSGRAMPQV
ncbi:MAG: hypothetical protein WKF51_08325 [Geodermatophilaceae bacterium]